MRRLISGAAGAVLAIAVSTNAGPAFAAGEVLVPPSQGWSWEGIFGTFDKAAAQRGFQVYKEVCAGCHALEYIYFRDLAGLGYSEDEVKAIAAEYEVEDGPDDDGEMFDRTAIASDPFVRPYRNDNEARSANNGALPPDLSLIVEARPNGADYLYALLTGYADEAPDGVEMQDGMSYNAWFKGHQIAMAQPLYEDSVEYADGTPATVSQMSTDVTTFLAWAAEPNLEQRKSMGIKVMIFLVIFLGLLIALKRKIWANVDH